MPTQNEMIQILRAEMDKQGVTDPELRAGIGAIAGGESGFQMKPELGYSHTANNRIRSIFGARVSSLDDDGLDALKSNDENFFNHVYGGNWGATNLGNTQPGDGFKFRGRGMFQLTGRSNYERYGKLIGTDITTDPEVANEPTVAAAIAVAYMKDRYHGGGWNGMKRAVGNNIPDIDTEKNRLFNQYLADGSFAPFGNDGPIDVGSLPPPPARPAIDRRKDIQKILAEGDHYKGEIDGVFGPQTNRAFVELSTEE